MSSVPNQYYINNPANDHKNDDKKIFVGGLGYSTKEDLQEYFGSYGKVVDITLKTDFQTGISRGFGFVLFDSEDPPIEVLKKAHHTLNNGRRIEAKSAKIRPGKEPELKIFVGGINPETPEETVKQHFEQYGQISDITFPKDKFRNVRKGFCFITFENEEACEKSVEWAKQEIGGKKCDVTKALPPDKKEALKSAKGQNNYQPWNQTPQNWSQSYGPPAQNWNQPVTYPPQSGYSAPPAVDYQNQPVYPPQHSAYPPSQNVYPPSQAAYTPAHNAHPAAYPPSQATNYAPAPQRPVAPVQGNPPVQGLPPVQGPPSVQGPPASHGPPSVQIPSGQVPQGAVGAPIVNGNGYDASVGIAQPVSQPPAYDYSNYGYGTNAPAAALPPTNDYSYNGQANYGQQSSYGKNNGNSSNHSYHPYQRTNSNF